MIRPFFTQSIFLFLPFVVLVGCTGGNQTEVSKSDSAETGVEVRLVIRWGGDDFASRQDLELRAIIERTIEARDVGRVLGSGTGMGWMDVRIKAENRTEAKKALEALMKEVAPQAAYSIAFRTPPLSTPQP
jgi:LmbE family N-acetylglucosaminyl deacetylase